MWLIIFHIIVSRFFKSSDYCQPILLSIDYRPPILSTQILTLVGEKFEEKPIRENNFQAIIKNFQEYFKDAHLIPTLQLSFSALYYIFYSK